MVTRARALVKATPSPTSRATFSLGAHWARPPKREKLSRISVEGVPGYPVPRVISPSRAARATASFPLNNRRSGPLIYSLVIAFLPGFARGQAGLTPTGNTKVRASIKEA